MAEVIRARRALTEGGWRSDVRIAIGDDGRIGAIEQDCAAGDGTLFGAILPAPANLHSHAFQRAMAGLTERRGPDPRDSFWTWRQLMFRFLDRLTPDHVEAITAFVQMEMLEAGYANNTEFHYLHHQPGGVAYAALAEMSARVAAAAAETGIGLTLLPVYYHHGGCDGRPLTAGQIRFFNDLDRFSGLVEGAAEAVRQLPADNRLGIAPHSLRAVPRDHLASLAIMEPDAPFHMHLAEQTAEVEEIEAAWGARPVEWLLDHAEVDGRWCLIHCTQMLPPETEGLARTGAVAGLCPITESSLGDGIFDGVRWLDHGGRFGIGSDSNIRIALAEELRTLEYSQRLRDRSRAVLATRERSTGRRLFEDAVRGAARAAGRGRGVIAVGQWADLLALDTGHVDLEGREGDGLIDAWIFAGDDRMVSDVWSAGRHLVHEGRHIRRDAIVRRYRAVMRELGSAL
ncbi:MAG: formimidoylglutamate deiminase [Geminicoccaceae bacterium]